MSPSFAFLVTKRPAIKVISCFLKNSHSTDGKRFRSSLAESDHVKVTEEANMWVRAE